MFLCRLQHEKVPQKVFSPRREKLYRTTMFFACGEKTCTQKCFVAVSGNRHVRRCCAFPKPLPKRGPTTARQLSEALIRILPRTKVPPGWWCRGGLKAGDASNIPRACVRGVRSQWGLALFALISKLIYQPKNNCNCLALRLIICCSSNTTQAGNLCEVHFLINTF